ncbi:MAG: HAD family hydrolase [Candidatus Hatepunaea meridiana]|nr:HAD family hydrolase [Candidatus Hatepunaea meridiana]
MRESKLLSLTRPKGILFDLGGTLIMSGFDREGGLKGLMDLIPDSHTLFIETVRDILDELIETTDSIKNKQFIQFSRSQFDRNLFARLGITLNLSDEELDIRFVENTFNVTVEPGAAEMLVEVKNMGIRTGLVSNSNLGGKCFTHFLQKWGLLAPLDFVMSSADYGFRKPHPGIFKTALAKLGTQPDETWFVGDTVDVDIEGSEAVGITAFWYNPSGFLPEGTTPKQEIRSWMEFINLLNDINT